MLLVISSLGRVSVSRLPGALEFMSLCWGDKVTGPFFPNDRNPILTSRHLSYDNWVHSTGHGDLFQLPDGRSRDVMDGMGEKGQAEWVIPSLKQTEKAPENGCLEYYMLSFWGVFPAYSQGRTACEFQLITSSSWTSMFPKFISKACWKAQKLLKISIC